MSEHSRHSRRGAAAHEGGHLAAARSVGAQLRVPFLIPAGLGIIGSFGAVTGIKGRLRDRGELLTIAAAGPAAGAALSFALAVIGLGLSVTRTGPLVEVPLPPLSKTPSPPPQPPPTPTWEILLQPQFGTLWVRQCER